MALRFLHVGKTGGTAIKDVLISQLGLRQTPYGRFSHASADTVQLHRVPREDFIFFSVRDPIARFASAFYSRYNKGKPRYFFDWFPEEADAFARFPSPQALADGLDSRSGSERRAAEKAMLMTKHVKRMTDRLGSRAELEERLDRIIYICRQETLPADMQHLRELLKLPPDVQLPSDAVRSHRGDPRSNRSFTESQEAALRRWYADDYEIIDFADKLRAENGWGQPIEGAAPGMAPPAERSPMIAAGAPLTYENLRIFLERKAPAAVMWSELLESRRAKRVGEIGTFRGKLAQELLNVVPTIETYYLMGPDERTDGWRDPELAGHDWGTAIERITWPTFPTVHHGSVEQILPMIDAESLDVFLLGYGIDRGLRSATLALQRGWSKLRPGGWIGGFGFVRDIFVRGREIEPSLVYPYALYFAEAMGVPIFGLPNQQFLIVKDPSAGFSYTDVVQESAPTALRPQVEQLLLRTVAEVVPEQSTDGGSTVVTLPPSPPVMADRNLKSTRVARKAVELGLPEGQGQRLERALKVSGRRLRHTQIRVTARLRR